MTNFELLLIFLIPVKKALFSKVSNINLRWIILEGNSFSILSSYQQIMLLFNLKYHFRLSVLELRCQLISELISLLVLFNSQTKTYSKFSEDPLKFGETYSRKRQRCNPFGTAAIKG